MNEVVVAYIPVLHEGYRRFLESHARGRRLFVVGRDLYEDYRPLAKDIRALDPACVAAAIGAWGLCESATVLDRHRATALSDEAPVMTLPAEDISYRIVERWFPRCPVQYSSVFLRWDKSRSVQLLEPRAPRRVGADAAMADLIEAAELRAGTSIDWWRRVGAAIRFADGTIATAVNEHHPHPLAPYVVGDPRANFSRGVHLEISTAEHAEARLIAQAAREGVSTAGATLYVTDFPCPPCAKLIAGAGITRLLFRQGYAVLDGNDVLEAAGVEIALIAA